MKYTIESEIRNLVDVVHFFEHLLFVKKVSFHPDDDFSEYVLYEDNSPCFTSEEVEIYNQLMVQCFEVCQRQKIDIYSIGLASMRRILEPNIQYNLEEGMLVRVDGKDEIFKITNLLNGKCLLTSLETDSIISVDEFNIISI